VEKVTLLIPQHSAGTFSFEDSADILGGASEDRRDANPGRRVPCVFTGGAMAAPATVFEFLPAAGIAW
jgi:hypothetical protein